MGKYMRKPNLAAGDVVVALMEVSHSSLGVRTRAKTLALQKLQASKSTTASPPPPPEKPSELAYLQLRSRRLEKPPVSCCNRQQNPNPSNGNGRAGSRLQVVMCSSVSGSVNSGSVRGGGEEETEESCYFGGRERSSRESTPCSLIRRDLNGVGNPGSRNLEASNRTAQNNSVRRSMPFAQEIEEFFARHDQEQQRRFADKYNFDMVNEKGLEGRYEWVRVESQ
ncbi:hypothetical protein OSB04_023174 [Centaurea solstitialis]|uniref:Cyclin-dependent kinase inhibitor domain-containing protein n=1 Tax=Centaurea solstitialis TaxID=347529 RepID=A0AA38W213_9ASTR|nr:hypothetical protein OSB04_023174 [Centaurea solstitialis]